MSTAFLTDATSLSDRDLLARLHALAGKERESCAELVAHLAALDRRPSAYAAQGYGSLFSYCTQALRLSEDAACNRIEAARACRRFPEILDLLVSGSVSLTAVRLLGRHLTPDNHQAVLAKASGRSRQQIEVLVAELAPRPDVPSTVRRLPTPTSADAAPAVPPSAQPSKSEATAAGEPSAPPPPPMARPVVQPTARERYRVQFTIGPETHEKLRRAQALLRREIPDGDPGVIFDRALALLLEKVEKAKVAAARHPKAARSIRPGTNKSVPEPAPDSRGVPRAVQRAVWQRDGGQCAFIAAGRRCAERTFLEWHHVWPHARRGPATIANISVRCRRHNQYEAELIFGPRRPPRATLH